MRPGFRCIAAACLKLRAKVTKDFYLPFRPPRFFVFTVWGSYPTNRPNTTRQPAGFFPKPCFRPMDCPAGTFQSYFRKSETSILFTEQTFFSIEFQALFRKAPPIIQLSWKRQKIFPDNRTNPSGLYPTQNSAKCAIHICVMPIHRETPNIRHVAHRRRKGTRDPTNDKQKEETNETKRILLRNACCFKQKKLFLHHEPIP